MQVLLELHNRGFGYGLGRKVRRSFSWHPAQRRIDVIRDLVERNYTSSSLRYDMIQACRNSDVYASFWGVCCGLGRVAGAEVVRKCANVDAAPAPRRRPRLFARAEPSIELIWEAMRAPRVMRSFETILHRPRPWKRTGFGNAFDHLHPIP